ncbi:MAG: amino acid ABC transporter permease [Spirochaetia bacterium]
MAGIFFLAIFFFMVDKDASSTIYYLSSGIKVTLYVTCVAYTISSLVGLGVAFMRISRWRILREIASFYVEIMRGMPVLVILYYLAFVLIPLIVTGLNTVFDSLINAGLIPPLHIRNISMTSRAIIALSLAYSAFMSEIFRAGIQSIDRGQYEAAKALGLSEWQTMRIIILPQAISRILPALINEFVALIKDSSLVSVLGVSDITQLGKLRSASNFKFLETYNVVAFLYLSLTLFFSSIAKYIEKRLEKGRR